MACSPYLNRCLVDSTTSKLRGFVLKLNNTLGILTAARILCKKEVQPITAALKQLNLLLAISDTLFFRGCHADVQVYEFMNIRKQATESIKILPFAVVGKIWPQKRVPPSKLREVFLSSTL